jgi:hypothetical protein
VVLDTEAHEQMEAQGQKLQQERPIHKAKTA